jgi:hypothetical protein
MIHVDNSDEKVCAKELHQEIHSFNFEIHSCP